MSENQRRWRVEFNVYPELGGFSYPHCVQQEAVSKGYCIKGAERRSVKPSSVFKYSLSGEGVLRIDGVEYRVPAGCAFLVNVNDPVIDYFYPEEAKEPWEFIFLAFNGAEKQVASINGRLGYIYHLQKESWLINSLLRYQENAESIQLLAPGEAHARVQSVLSSLIDSVIMYGKSGGKRRLFSRVSEMIHKNIEQRLSLVDVAEKMDMSKEHLSRSFRGESGMTVLEYIQREQMRHARVLLKEGNLSIKEISARLGFTNPSHFNRVFKRIAGMTPLDYRENGISYI